MTQLVRLSQSGQITIPAELRKELDITEDTFLQVTVVDGELRLRPIDLVEHKAGNSTWLQDLCELFEPVREEAKGMSEEEINIVINQAIKAVRRKNGL
jgi:AbrB family looped-hinge helix DNA binding protein